MFKMSNELNIKRKVEDINKKLQLEISKLKNELIFLHNKNYDKTNYRFKNRQ